MVAGHDSSGQGTSVDSRIVNRLTELVGEGRFQRYFEDSARLTLDKDDATLDVAVPSEFHAEWLGRRFGKAVKRAASLETGNPDLTVRWHVDPQAFRRGTTPESRAATSMPTPARAGTASAEAKRHVAAGRSPEGSRAIGFDPKSDRYSLDNFVIGSCNRLAHTVASRFVAGDPTPGLNLLMLHGDCGLGKTHLLQGIAAGYLARHPGSRVRYISGEAFTNEYIRAVRGGNIESFRRAFRTIDLLCLDDMHFLAGKDGTQSEFLHTFDALDLHGAKVALASDAHPRQIANLNQRLASRCVAGMVVQLEQPDFETRLEALENLARRRGLCVEPEAIRAVAGSCCGSFRDLGGVLTRIQALATLLPETMGGRKRIGTTLVETVLRGQSRHRMNRPVRVDEILDAVCHQLQVEPSEVLGRGRHRRIVLARGVTAFLARELTTQSFPEIGRALNRNNHSTIVTASQRVARQIDEGARCRVGQSLQEVRLTELCQRVRQQLSMSPGATRTPAAPRRN